MTRRGEPAADERRLKHVDHTHPERDTPAGRLFRRGPAVVADGGRHEREVAGAEGSETARLGDLEHAPPAGELTAGIWRRGVGDGPVEPRQG